MTKCLPSTCSDHYRTFLKRKGGLFKKAHELSVLCSVDVAVIIFGHNKKLYEFSSGDIGETLTRYSYVCHPTGTCHPANPRSMAHLTSTKDPRTFEEKVEKMTRMKMKMKRPVDGRSQCRRSTLCHLTYNTPIPSHIFDSLQHRRHLRCKMACFNIVTLHLSHTWDHGRRHEIQSAERARI
jgi:hypothetical protein